MSHSNTPVSNRLEHAERLLRHAPDFILAFGKDGLITYMNRPAPGHTLEDMLGTPVKQWMSPDDHHAFDQTMREVFQDGQVSSYESVGSVTGRKYVHRVSPVAEDGVVTSAILITHDITELKDTQTSLAETEERYRAMAEASFDGLVLSVGGEVIDCNQALAEMFQRERVSLVGVRPAELVTDRSLPTVLANMHSGSERPYEVVGVRADGTHFPAELRGKNITFQGQPARLTGVRDLTIQRSQERAQIRREERVRHAEKLETLGVLSGGVAHDFNNILAAILANAEVALEGDVGGAQRALERIRTAAIRARGLSNQLLVYAGRATRSVERISLNQLLLDTMQLMTVSIANKADLVLDLAEDLPTVDGDLGQLAQVLMNLITNASDSLGDEPGHITVRTALIELDSERIANGFASPNCRSGPHAVFEIVDTGCGVSTEDIVLIFDPFYTTKFAGRGLGLASVMGIVRSHGGMVEVESVVGQGTAFRIMLPVSNGRTPLPAEKATAPLQLKTGTVLLADDEPMLLEITNEILQRSGFEVIQAVDGVQALKHIREHGPDLMAVVLDVTMPRRTGIEVLETLRQHHPTLPVVLMSGYTDAEIGQSPERLPYTEFVKKPFELNELIAALASAGVPHR